MHGTWMPQSVVIPEVSPFGVTDVQRSLVPGWPLNVNELAIDYTLGPAGRVGVRRQEVSYAPAVPSRVVTQHEDFHYRLYGTPDNYTLRDPEIGAQYPFEIWNTFYVPNPNVLEDIVFDGIEGLDVTPPVGTGIHDFGLTTFSFALNTDAPPSMSGTVTLVFGSGEFSLSLSIERDTTVPLPPSFPWTETLRWETQVIVSEDGSEQRICLSVSPEVTHDVRFVAINRDETQELFEGILSTSRNAPTVPQYQYASPTKQDSTVNATTLMVSPRKGDIRPGDNVIIRDRKGQGEGGRVVAVGPDSITLSSPLVRPYQNGSMVIPSIDLILPAQQTFNRSRVQASEYMLSGRPRNRRAPFLSEQNTVELPTVAGRPYIDKRSLSDEQQSLVFDSGRRFFNEGRVIAVKDPWRTSRQNTPVSFIVDSFFRPDEWDYWRTFMEHCRGAQKAFMYPTYRPDFRIAAPIGLTPEILVVHGNSYSAIFSGQGVYPALRIETEAGVHVSEISGHFPLDPTKEQLVLTRPLPMDPGWDIVKTISLVATTRLLTDEIRIEHYTQHSILKATFRTTKA